MNPNTLRRTKECKKCNAIFNAPSFTFVYKNGKSYIKYRTQCNQCRNKTNLERLKHTKTIKKKNTNTNTENTFKSRRIFSIEERRKRINQQNKNWRKNNPEKWKTSNRLNKHRRRALGNINSSEWIAKVIVLGNKCQFCFKTEPEVKITIDHIIPVSKGGTNKIDNLQPLCMSCNQKKYTRISPVDLNEIQLITIYGN